MRIFRCLRIKFINFLFEGTKLMATFEEVKAGVESAVSSLAALDLKLDEVKAKIDSLSAGVVSQEQLDELAALVNSAKDSSAAVFAEASALVAPVE